MPNDPDGQIILEITSIGHSLEVRAIAHDGLEVAFIAPVSATEAELMALGRAKLDYVRRKAGQAAPTSGSPPRDGRGGIVV
jgi:hypothetical protein